MPLVASTSSRTSGDSVRDAMNRSVVLAAGGIVIIAIGAGIAISGPPPEPAHPSARPVAPIAGASARNQTPNPQPTPSAAGPTAAIRLTSLFQSPLYGYAVGVDPAWTTRPGTFPWL